MRGVMSVSPFKCRLWAMHDRLGHDGHAHRALLESMRAHGQKRPALGRYLPKGSEHDVELIYGARRLAAAMELGIELLVDIREIDDRAALVEMDIENRVREDISPYERGLSYKRWLRSGSFKTQAEMAKALGISEAQVCRLLKYADLPAALIAAFKSPRDIREEWAGTLSGRCKDLGHRETIIRRARGITAIQRALSPQDVYNALISDAGGRVATSRPRDEVVKSEIGKPLFRVGIRTTTVHLIIPRAVLSAEKLTSVAEQLRLTLDDSPSPQLRARER